MTKHQEAEAARREANRAKREWQRAEAHAKHLEILAQGYDSGPENERGKDWFGNDGIDCHTARVMPARQEKETATESKP